MIESREATDKQLAALADEMEAGRAWIGSTRDFTGVTVKVIAALHREAECEPPSARFKWGPNGMVVDPEGGYIWIDTP